MYICMYIADFFPYLAKDLLTPGVFIEILKISFMFFRCFYSLFHLYKTISYIFNKTNFILVC